MALTPNQRTALKADIAADPTISGLPVNSDTSAAIADLYNQASSPAFTVWRTSVGTDEIMSTGFIWTVVDGMTVGKARIWEWMMSLGTLNPSKANIRQGLVDAFGAGSAMANAITPTLKRVATRAERLFATGTGSDGTPGLLTFEGALSSHDVDDARNA